MTEGIIATSGLREHQVGEADLLEHVHHALLST
jgi:hypothetical protein